MTSNGWHKRSPMGSSVMSYINLSLSLHGFSMGLLWVHQQNLLLAAGKQRPRHKSQSFTLRPAAVTAKAKGQLTSSTTSRGFANFLPAKFVDFAIKTAAICYQKIGVDQVGCSAIPEAQMELTKPQECPNTLEEAENGGEQHHYSLPDEIIYEIAMNSGIRYTLTSWSPNPGKPANPDPEYGFAQIRDDIDQSLCVQLWGIKME